MCRRGSGAQGASRGAEARARPRDRSADNRIMWLVPAIGFHCEPSRIGTKGNGLDIDISTSTYTFSPSDNAPITCVALRVGPSIHWRSFPSPPRRNTPKYVGFVESHDQWMPPLLSCASSNAIGITK